ncbi:hypothetical protein V6N11_062261 [Hibiscus sabdariffa]|uniref:Uncharacterized protein n=1 Tax=Hibiscus sabdariffa TaxID=183260 RepID=A0ABR2PS18_9ROSI
MKEAIVVPEVIPGLVSGESSKVVEARAPNVDVIHESMAVQNGDLLVEQVSELVSVHGKLDVGSERATVLDQNLLQEVDSGLNVSNSEVSASLDVEFPSLQDSTQQKRGCGRPAKQKKDDDKAMLMGKIQGKKRDLIAKAELAGVGLGYDYIAGRYLGS